MRVQTIFLTLALWGIGVAAMAQATGAVVPVPAPVVEATARGPVKVESLQAKRMRVKCSTPQNRSLPECAVFLPATGGK
jgi:hypothetical protein